MSVLTMMNDPAVMGAIRGLLTLLLMLAFVFMVVRLYSAKHRQQWEQAAWLPLEDDAVIASISSEKFSNQKRNVDKVSSP